MLHFPVPSRAAQRRRTAPTRKRGAKGQRPPARPAARGCTLRAAIALPHVLTPPLARAHTGRRAGLLRVDWVSLGAPLGHAREPKAYEGERFFRDAGAACVRRRRWGTSARSHSSRAGLGRALPSRAAPGRVGPVRERPLHTRPWPRGRGYRGVHAARVRRQRLGTALCDARARSRPAGGREPDRHIDKQRVPWSGGLTRALVRAPMFVQRLRRHFWPPSGGPVWNQA